MRFDTVALIVAAGRGERAGGPVPKQFAMLGGAPVVARAVEAFGPIPVFVVIAEGQGEAFAEAMGDRTIAGVVTGGATRRESVLRGLLAIESAGGARHVMIHDAARPLLPRAVVERLLAALATHKGAIPALPVADTLARADWTLGSTVDRRDVVRVQTPQAFLFDLILHVHRSWPGDKDVTDDAQMLRDAGHEVMTVAGDPMLDKITLPEDFARAEAMLGSRMISRSATGFDVHRLETGKALWLCGVRIDHCQGLSGHSDADVALHALTDALLGTIAEGDIGSHFPPTDPQWRGAASALFLAHARQLIGDRGGVIDHVDLTLICEAPRLAPHREAMRERIAEILQIPVSRVSVKATTTERLGFTGRGEGIAAQAVATVRVPEDM